MMVLFQMPLLPLPTCGGEGLPPHRDSRRVPPRPYPGTRGEAKGLNRTLNDYDRGGRTGAENCSVRSRSLMSTTVSIGADSS